MDENPEEVQEREETVTLTKAEYDKLNQTLGSLKKEVKTYKKEAEAPQESNYDTDSVLSRIERRGVMEKEDQDYILAEAKLLNRHPVDILNMPHVQAQLAANNNQRLAESGSPTGTGRKGGPGKGDVDYYLAHPDEVPPDLNLHNEVIDARIKREQENSMFSSTPFIG